MLKWSDILKATVGVGVAATLVAALIPVAASASGQLVTLVDSDTTSKAQVDDGELRVGDGAGLLTTEGRTSLLVDLHPTMESQQHLVREFDVTSYGRIRVFVGSPQDEVEFVLEGLTPKGSVILSGFFTSTERHVIHEVPGKQLRLILICHDPDGCRPHVIVWGRT